MLLFVLLVYTTPKGLTSGKSLHWSHKALKLNYSKGQIHLKQKPQHQPLVWTQRQILQLDPNDPKLLTTCRESRNNATMSPNHKTIPSPESNTLVIVGSTT